MGTRLMWLLGFKADNDYPVRVTCLNCPKDPWGVYKSFRDQTGGLDKDKPADVERAKQIAASLGGSRSTRTYANAVIEIKFAGSKIKVDGIDCAGDREASDPRCGGFSWNETGQISESAGGAPRAQVDALKLLAAFMTHGDNKPGNQRLVCPDDKKNPDGTCAKPFAMIQDIGAGFGSKGGFLGLSYRKADIGAWSGQPLWDDINQCRAKLSSIHELKNPVVSDEGRAFLAKLMDPAVLTDDKVTAIFEASRIVEKGDSFNGHPATVADWVAAFNRKRSDMARSCGSGHESVAPSHPSTRAAPPPRSTGEHGTAEARDTEGPEIVEAGTLPIREVSGLGLRTQGNKKQVLAIGDRDFELAVGTLANDAVRSFDIVDLKKVMRDGGADVQAQSQWEGVKSDGSGRVFVLEETPGHVFIFNNDLTTLEAQIELQIKGTDPDIATLEADWDARPNSRGEGLALLGRGHLLILKEKQSRRLIEFGPEGDEPVGLTPLTPSERFAMPDRKSTRMVPLKIWKFSEESQVPFSDVSDLDADHAGRLWVLTDEVRRWAVSRNPMRRAVSTSATSSALPAPAASKSRKGSSCWTTMSRSSGATSPIATSPSMRCQACTERRAHLYQFRIPQSEFRIPIHSCLNATIGSTADARRAGIRHATSAASSSVAVTVLSATRSIAPTPNHIPCMARPTR